MNINLIKNPFDLSDKVVVVMGIGDLGQVIAPALAYRGANVFCFDILEDEAKKASESCTEANRESFYKQVDITSEQSIEAACKFVMDRYGKIDILVNSFAMTFHCPTIETTSEDWDKVMDINAKGVFLSTRTFGRQMVAQGGGSIINFTSIYGIVGSGRGNMTYAASKGLVIGMTKELAIEWAPNGVRINAIAPCQFMGKNLEKMVRDEFDYDKLVNKWKVDIPLGKVGSPEEITGAVIFLASDAACMVTGIVLPVDGGYLAK